MTRQKMTEIICTEQVKSLIDEIARRQDVKIKVIDKFYTEKEVAEIFSVSLSTVRRWVKGCKLQYLKIDADNGKNGVRRFSASCLEKFIKEHTIQSVQSP